MSLPGGWELVLIVAVIVLLFGAKKLPDAARSLGRSMRIFKSEIKEMGNDDQAQQPPQQQITGGTTQAQVQNVQDPQQVNNPQNGQ
ncbi:Sec-independent protein translocase subunit TatA [Corynebacterium vitaeruminis]|uniref:Sec-independent protein translocase subunit TatA n=1 Tax=Corynebacterium vitaeruminis TaxID=38305 RepID=UPI00054E7EF1|nr:Sec-independent protein translocase subunit TatA [Corynebacterium vitaeruminis]